MEYDLERRHEWLEREKERANSTPANYMSRQNDINARMREILIDWLLEVQLNFKLRSETIHLSVQLLDRFLAKRLVSRTKLQLVGCTSLLLAAKILDIHVPKVAKFVAISDKAYISEHILAMEGIFTNALGFDLGWPTAFDFHMLLTREHQQSMANETCLAAHYILDSTMQCYEALQYRPSLLAIATWKLLSVLVPTTSGVPEQFSHEWSGHTDERIRECVIFLWKHMLVVQRDRIKYRAIVKKFALDKFARISTTFKLPEFDEELLVPRPRAKETKPADAANVSDQTTHPQNPSTDITSECPVVSYANNTVPSPPQSPQETFVTNGEPSQSLTHDDHASKLDKAQ